VALEDNKTLFEIGERGEIVRRDDISVDQREVDFDWVEPTGVDGRGIRITLGHAFWPGLAEQWSRIQKAPRADW
jgi:hypothetical protein